MLESQVTEHPDSCVSQVEGLQQTVVGGCMYADGSSKLEKKKLSSSHFRDEARYNFTSHHSSKNRDTDRMVIRRVGEPEHRTTQAV